MSLIVFLSVLGAALLHASWNALVRVGASRVGTMMVLSGVQGLIGLVIAMTMDWPGAAVWPWLVASGVVHSAYKIFLTFAYEHGDLSRVYPLARGTAPMITLMVGAIWLGEAVSMNETAGIVVLGVGILALARGVWTSGESRRMLPFAFGAACATAGYTVVDGLGARVAEDAALFVAWLFVLDGIIFAAAMLALRGRGSLPTGWRVWTAGSLGAAASYGSYAVAVWAMTLAPIALVAALRETSILFGVLIGWLMFGERMTPGKALSVALIAAGVVLTRI
ncbi:DMT family transporter [Defluviimonas sp. WL0050]|uniref:DMT family transporter n=1 Tax=Albidovulum litorale TaxID=2984134 RepID=A0ABT2ZL10_9RHOB|nr:DMT family transporter [Defluviimonas sp. WL0050]MCV2871747.1 DMT family transporter [Defluviimonas sp. WL0050]